MLRVVAVDLDGTLLRSDKTVSARTTSALKAATDAGARVVIVTARPPRFVRSLADEAGVSGLAICSNGAIVYDLATDRFDVVGPLPIAVAERTAVAIAAVMPGAAFAVETGRRALIGPGYGHVASGDNVREITPDLWATTEGCAKLLAWSTTTVTDEMVATIQARVPDVVVSYSGAAGMIEISAAGVTKVDALGRLCTCWGVTRDEVIAFGDAPNDLLLLRWAGLGIAVANAHPDVLACADRITASNDDDGVAAVIEEFLPSYRLGSLRPSSSDREA